MAYNAHRRMYRFLDYVAPEHSIFYITQLPPTSWGADNTGSFLCATGTDEPLLIWMIGSVEKMAVGSSTLEKRCKVELNLQFLRKADHTAVKDLLYLIFSGKTLELSRVAIDEEGLPSVFDAVFDASIEYKSRDAMHKLQCADILFGDIVLAEFYCYRWRAPRMSTNNATPSWRNYFTACQLQSVSVLHQTPRSHCTAPPPVFSGVL
ncbi:hypothetical protein C2E23DRAFT_727567 [Lenzites betulinus]|nr:hypothetical protein C2E23DRAFT_727567 [Lenzites betulinus]